MTVAACFLTAAAAMDAPQGAKSESEITDPPFIMISCLTDDYPSKFKVSIEHWMQYEGQDVEIYYTLKAFPDDDDSQALYSGPYMGPIYFDCYNYIEFFMRPWSWTYYFTAYAVAGMEPSELAYDELHFDYIDFCYTLHNPDAFYVDGFYYEENSDDQTTVSITHSDGGFVEDFDNSIPPAMKLWNYDYPDVVDLVIPSEITHEGQTYQVTRIDGMTFAGLENLRSVTIPPTIKTVGPYAFLNSNNLEDIYISDLEAWCRIKFDYWSGLLSMISPGDINFHVNNTILTNLVIPDNIDSLFCSFTGLRSLRSVVIPASVRYMDNVFVSCDSIKTATCLATTPPELSGDWPDFQVDYTSLYVPKSALESYKNHPVWGKMNHIYAIEDRGDVNGNGSINISDVTTLISYLLGTESGSFNEAFADVNGDSIINISDVTALINILLEGD